MKNLFLLLLTTISFSSFGQMTYVPLDNVYDFGLPNETATTEDIDVDGDGDGYRDFRINFVDNSPYILLELTFGSANPVLNASVLVKDTTVGSTDPSSSRAQDCKTATYKSGYQVSAYFYYVEPGFVNYVSGYKKVPFKFEDVNHNNYCGFLFVNYENGGQLITITGYSWNETPGGICPCDDEYLGVNELTQPQKTGNFKYYNLMGQELKNPSGVVLKVYDSGLNERVYISN